MSFNLLPWRQRRAQRQQRYWVASGVVIALLATSTHIPHGLGRYMRRAELEAQWVQMRSEHGHREARASKAEIVDWASLIQDQQDRLEWLEPLETVPPPIRLSMSTVLDQRPQWVWIEAMSWQHPLASPPSPGRLEVRGGGLTADDIQQFEKALAHYFAVMDVVIDHRVGDAGRSDHAHVDFVITLALPS